ncbi:MAG TPA: serine/threonine-protein kinase [Gemmataceae bacterium]|nr:serine/threonine-protein kinase [Gemmataceae bacterium]
MTASASLDAIFAAAIELPSPAEREVYIARACGGDVALRARVKELVAAHFRAGNFLESAAPELAATIDQPALEGPGTVIGHFRLMEQVGEGGMGVVFVAEQLHPVRRKVALKLIKPGMDTREVVARFEQERQALALMDHPHIARVLDAGVTDHGRPFFVMELVRGIPVTDYCDRARLGVPERLHLFVQVCQAVQHAHQKGVIHRDLKPGNVLVTEHDGTPVAKVIDFGVAKAVGPRLTDRTVYTRFMQMVGSPLYMSPEQAGLSGLDVDTRADVYALGVLLYELLTGTTPFDQERMRDAEHDEVRRIIREEEPPKPSTRLSTLGRAADTLSANRGSEPRKLSALVRGDLDWIVMKALEKDRNRRYESASALAADVQRYLADEPVQACPPSFWYRSRKLARRNKAALATLSVMVLAALVAAGSLAVSNVRISHEAEEKAKAFAAATASEQDAKIQAGLAKTSADNAETERRAALAQEKLAKQQELTARRRFYAAQMNLSYQAWEAGNPARVLELLEGQRPRLDQEDLRSFEWYYLWRLCHRNCRLTLHGHANAVFAVAFGPDGKTLASASWDGTSRLWDLTTGKEQAKLRRPGALWALAVSPDGKTLATTGESEPVTLWDVATGQERPLGSPSGFTGLAWTRDAKTVAAAGARLIKLWDAATGQEQATLRGDPKEVFPSVAFAPDGKTVAAGTSEKSVRLWTSEGGNWRKGTVLKGLEGWVRSVAFSPDGKTLAAGSGWTAKVWDVATGKERAVLQGHKGTVESVAFSPDGKTLATGSEDRTVRLWDVATGQERAQQAHLAPVYAVAFSTDGKTLASGSGDGAVKVWDLAPVQDADTLPHTGAVHVLAFTPDGKTLHSDPTQVWDLATGKRAIPFQHITAEQLWAISPDCRILASPGLDKTVKIWNLATGKEQATIPVQMEVVAVAFSPDGRTLATWRPWYGDVVVKLWDVATGQARGTLSTPKGGRDISILSVAFSPDGKTLAAGLQFHSVKVWDVATGRLKLNIRQDTRGLVCVTSVMFSPDGRTLAAGTDMGTVRLWDMDTGHLRASLKGHTNAIRSLAFSPDGKTLASGSDDTTAKLWDVATGQERMTLKGHKAARGSVAFAPDGNTLATGSADGTVKLWRAATDVQAKARKTDMDPDDPDSVSRH